MSTRARAGTGAVILAVALLSLALARSPLEAGPVLASLCVAGAALLSLPEHWLRALLLVGAGAALTVSVGVTPTDVLERDLSLAFAPLVVPLAAAALIRDPRLAALAVAGGLVAGPVRAAFHDPFYDVDCVGCGHAVLALWPLPDVVPAVALTGAAMALGGVALALRNEREPLALAAVATLFVLDLLAVAPDATGVLACLVAAAASTRPGVARWRRRARARRLLSALEAGDDLTTTLRRDLGDDAVRLAFPTPEGSWVDVAGRPIAADGPAWTDLLLHERILARVHHSSHTSILDLDTALDDTARLMLDNERLDALLAARVLELTRSRAAVVEVGVAERWSAERDLHDGVQQELLALGLELRLALTSTDADSRSAVTSALESVNACCEEVRDISRGIYPPLLATRGLSAAVAALVRRSARPIEVGVPTGRLAVSVERAAFAVASEAVARGATSIEVTLEDDRLLLTAHGCGPGEDGILPDVVAALGGELSLAVPTTWAVIPCES